VAIAFAVVAALLVADFLYVLHRARREWDGGDFSSPMAFLITSLYLLIAGLLAMAIAWRPWPLAIPLDVTLVVGGLLALGGLALAAPGFMPFASVRQLYGVERGGLITDGIYRYSRNPQYTGLGSALLGVSVVGRSGLALLVVAAYWVAVRAWLVIEEEHLESAFNDEYVQYREATPRFLGWRNG
jgi:protein-S-isoprenylcysteine O-methyltransferase Ste14